LASSSLMSAADQVRRGPGTEVVVVANADSRLVGGPGAGAVAVRAIDQVAGSADRRVVRERGAPRPGRTLVTGRTAGCPSHRGGGVRRSSCDRDLPAGAIGRARRRCGAHKPASSCTANIRLRRVYSQTAGVSLRRVIGGPAATLPARSPGPVLGSGQPGETCSIFGQGHLDWPSTRPSTCCARAIKTTLEAEPVGRWRSTRSISCCFLWRSE